MRVLCEIQSQLVRFIEKLVPVLNSAYPDLCCRYVVWSKVFGAWRLFVLYQKASAEKMELAAAIGKSCFKVRVENLE